MDHSVHIARRRSGKGVRVTVDKFRFQRESALSYDHGSIGALNDASEIIRRQAVFAFIRHNVANDAAEVHEQVRYTRDCHDYGYGLVRALRPHIPRRKGVSRIFFDIPHARIEVVTLSVHFHITAYIMLHADDTVATLHERNAGERAHDVAAYG